MSAEYGPVSGASPDGHQEVSHRYTPVEWEAIFVIADKKLEEIAQGKSLASNAPELQMTAGNEENVNPQMGERASQSNVSLRTDTLGTRFPYSK